MRVGETIGSINNIIHLKVYGAIRVSNNKILRRSIKYVYIEYEGMFFELRQEANQPIRVIDCEPSKEQLFKVFNDTNMRVHMAGQILHAKVSNTWCNESTSYKSIISSLGRS